MDVRFFIYGERIDPTERDLYELAVGMNGAVIAGLSKVLNDMGGTLLVEETIGVADTPTGFDIDVVAEVAGPPDVQQRMLVVALINSVVAIYVRLESARLMGDDLRTLWRNIRSDLFLAEPAPPNA